MTKYLFVLGRFFVKLIGDTHLHTALSMDAGSFGNRLGLEEAYRFTRGEEVTASGGFKAKMGRPLDFVVIADHSDGMGFFQMFQKGDPLIMDNELGRRWHKMINEGGDLRKGAAGKSPAFLVAAMKDSMSGNLDRLQIVKGWVGKDGKAQERVYDVAVSDDRKIGADGRCKTPVGNTVNVEQATWTNTIGDPELITVWTDPDFDAKQRAFYYVRVLEIPTPRWTAYEAKRFGVKMPEGCKMTTQERAYTAPIWYTP